MTGTAMGNSIAAAAPTLAAPGVDNVAWPIETVTWSGILQVTDCGSFTATLLCGMACFVLGASPSPLTRAHAESQLLVAPKGPAKFTPASTTRESRPSSYVGTA